MIDQELNTILVRGLLTFTKQNQDKKTKDLELSGVE